FDLRLAGTGRFPEALYLRPDPAEPFVAMTTEVVREWPEAQPYGGAFDDVGPHLTVVSHQPATGIDQGDAALDLTTAVRTPVAELQLFAFDGRSGGLSRRCGLHPS